MHFGVAEISENLRACQLSRIYSTFYYKKQILHSKNILLDYYQNPGIISTICSRKILSVSPKLLNWALSTSRTATI